MMASLEVIIVFWVFLKYYSDCYCVDNSRWFSIAAVYEGEYIGQQVAVKIIKCDVTAQSFLLETAVMT